MINSMMVTGLESLPGMMTCQLLSDISPVETMKFQNVIMLFISSGTAFHTNDRSSTRSTRRRKWSAATNDSKSIARRRLRVECMHSLHDHLRQQK